MWYFGPDLAFDLVKRLVAKAASMALTPSTDLLYELDAVATEMRAGREGGCRNPNIECGGRAAVVRAGVIGAAV